jgi:hypothetical protein
MEVTRLAASSVEGFIQQLAVSCVARGYVFYVCGRVPEHKDPRELDRKMAERYLLALSKWSRARRKRAGLANVRYLRFDRFFVLVATPGEHRFFADEAGLIQDCRRVPIKFGGYSVSSRGGKVHVRIEREQYNLLKSYFLEVALRRRADALERMVASLPFEPYAPVRRQLLNLVRAINAERKAAGFEPLGFDCIRMKRRIVKPFARTVGPAAEPRDEASTGSSPVEPVHPDRASRIASRAES